MSTEVKLPKFPVLVPNDVKVNLDDNLLTVRGPKGECSKDFSKIPVVISLVDDGVSISPFSSRKRALSIANTAKSIIENMTKGVVAEYRYRLKVVFAHFPITVKVKDKEVHIENFLGERTPRRAGVVGACKVSVEGDDVIVEGISKEDVGQTAANLEQATRIKKKDQRVFLDGVYVYAKK